MRLSKWEDIFALEPDDLWGRLFIRALRRLREESQVNRIRITALHAAVTEMRRVVDPLVKDGAEEYGEAMRKLDEAQRLYEEEFLRRDLDMFEDAAVIAKLLLAEHGRGA